MKKKKIVVNIILVAIFGLAFFLRIYKLGEIPPGLSWDEANNGYEAYLILKTGKDEWGEKFPIFSKRFGDYSSQIYSYFTAVTVYFLNLTPFAVRLPSAIMGSLSALFFYFLTKNFLELASFKENNGIALISSILWAINPWNIHFSRHALEVNVALSLAIISLTLLFSFLINSKYFNFSLSVIFAVLSIYTYYNSRLVMPLLFAYLFILKRKFFLDKKTPFFASVILGLILLMPFFNFLQKGLILRRHNDLSIFSDAYRKQKFNQLLFKDKQKPAVLELFFHNKLFFYSQEILNQMIRQLSPEFLFIGGDSNLRYGVREYGKFLYPGFIFLPAGLFYFLNKKKLGGFLLFWIFAAILPTAFSNESPHPLRAYFLLPPFLLLISIGIYSIIFKLSAYKRIFGIVLISFFYLLSFSLYFHYYLTHFPREADYDWHVFYKPVIDFLSENQDKYDKIIFTTHYYQPHIFLFFYQKINPVRVQNAIIKERPAFFSNAAVDRFEKFQFRPVNWKEDMKCDNCLIIDNNYHPEILENSYLAKNTAVRRLKTVRFNTGKPAFSIFETIKIE